MNVYTIINRTFYIGIKNCKETHIFFIKWHQEWISDAKTSNNRHYWIKALKNSPQYKHFPQFGFYWKHGQVFTCEITSVNGSYYTSQTIGIRFTLEDGKWEEIWNEKSNETSREPTFLPSTVKFSLSSRAPIVFK